MMKLLRRTRALIVWLLLLGLLTLACRLTSEPPATVAPAATAEVATATESTADDAAEVPPATNTPLPSATAVLAATEQPPTSLPQATSTEVATEAATEAPMETATAVSTPATVGETFAPGQQDTVTLAAGEFQVYPYQGTAFQPVLVFVEPDDMLDVAVAAYEGSITAEAELGDSPRAQVDANTAGGPELMVFTPNEDGPYSLLVSNSAEEGGQYTVYLFDATAEAATVALSQTATLVAGESQRYTAQSHGGRPVLVFVDQAGQSDLMVEVLNENEQLIAEANFGGSGSAEAVYALPLQTTTYTVRVSEVAGGTASYSILIVTLN